MVVLAGLTWKIPVVLTAPVLSRVIAGSARGCQRRCLTSADGCTAQGRGRCRAHRDSTRSRGRAASSIAYLYRIGGGTGGVDLEDARGVDSSRVEQGIRSAACSRQRRCLTGADGCTAQGWRWVGVDRDGTRRRGGTAGATGYDGVGRCAGGIDRKEARGVGRHYAPGITQGVAGAARGRQRRRLTGTDGGATQSSRRVGVERHGAGGRGGAAAGVANQYGIVGGGRWGDGEQARGIDGSRIKQGIAGAARGGEGHRLGSADSSPAQGCGWRRVDRHGAGRRGGTASGVAGLDGVGGGTGRWADGKDTGGVDRSCVD